MLLFIPMFVFIVVVDKVWLTLVFCGLIIEASVEVVVVVSYSAWSLS